MLARLMLVLSLAVVTTVTGCRNVGHEEGQDLDRTVQRIALEDVPQPVRAGLEKEFPSARIQKVKKETYANGTVHYEFELIGADGKRMEVELDEDGEVLEAH
jgi:hypothetical protein